MVSASNHIYLYETYWDYEKYQYSIVARYIKWKITSKIYRTEIVILSQKYIQETYKSNWYQTIHKTSQIIEKHC